MKTMMHDFSGTVKKSPEIMTIHTTLYDLSAALSAEVGPHEEDVVTAAVIHLLNTHRVTCTGNLQGYRLRACNERGHTAMHSDGTRQGRRSRRPDTLRTGVVSAPPVAL
jgi:hypothetical protein